MFPFNSIAFSIPGVKAFAGVGLDMVCTGNKKDGGRFVVVVPRDVNTGLFGGAWGLEFESG